MNTQIRMSVLRHLGAVVVLALISAGCVKNEIASGPIDPEPQGPIFNFSTKEVSILKIKYDVPEGYQVYFEVYTQNPEELNADGQIVKKNIQPVDVGFTDGAGLYNQKIELPATAQTLYIYSPYAGVPRVLVAQVNNNGVSEAKLPEVTAASAQAFAITRAPANYKDAPYNTFTRGNLKRLGYWMNDNGYQLGTQLYTLYGRPDYLLTDKILVSADILNLINATLPEGGHPDSKLIKNGDIHVTEKAHVDIHLIDEQTSANSTLAYYCYDTQNPPKTRADIQNNIAVVFPNAKVLKYHGYTPQGNNGAMERGEGVRLHYWKDGVDMGEEFPAGTSIGWVIYNQSYAAASNNTPGPLNAGASHFFAAGALNDNKTGHVALFRSGDKVIFGLEDWPGDYDYNDVVFYVKADPIQAITPDVPEVKPEEPSDDKVSATVVHQGILTFEDIWPYRGDFDMNDVVIRYDSEVGYNQKNEVVQTTDKYTVLASGAEINNSFAYQLDVRRSEVEVSINSSLGGEGGAYVDQTLDRATIRLANKLLPYANNNTKVTFEVLTKYTGRRIAKSDFTKPPYNPFITTTTEDIEVHLTNMRPTEKLNKALLGYGHDQSDPGKNLYYITHDEAGIQMPFAINIAFEKKEDVQNFVIPKERVRIDLHYPNFLNWVKTGGVQDKDWYLKPKQ